MDLLHHRGCNPRRSLPTWQSGPEPQYQFAPVDPAIAPAVAALAGLYATHRVSIISMIFSKPADRLRSFADAFRFRKDKNDG
jgi:hypothetical protein